MDARSFMTATLAEHPRGAEVAEILRAAVAAADPYAAVSRYLRLERDHLVAGTGLYDLRHIDRVLVLAVGKAAVPMARAALSVLRDSIAGGLVVTKATDDAAVPSVDGLTVLAAAHPLPDERSVHAGERAVALLEAAGERDLVLVLLSGGGSALLTLPEDGIGLDDMRDLTVALLRSGATIDEVNALRRRCDRVKGGGLARAAFPATVAVLVLSDVVGDDLSAIASGPFVAPDASQLDARAVVERYGLRGRLPASVSRSLDAPAPATVATWPNIRHTIIANVEAAAEGAIAQAQASGFETELLTTTLHGEARDVGAEVARMLVETDRPSPCCWIAGGETTVTLRGDGLGGRNQELALATVPVLAGHDDRLLVSLATDGGDGPTDAAGAVVGGGTLGRGQTLGLDPRAYLQRNDAYHYFEPLGDLLKPGPTHTNVNDLVLLFAL